MRVLGTGTTRRTHRKRVTFAVGVATLALATAACGSGSDGESSEIDADAEVSAEGETLTVWIMEGTNPDAEPFFDGLSTAFEDGDRRDARRAVRALGGGARQVRQLHRGRARPPTSPRSAPPGRRSSPTPARSSTSPSRSPRPGSTATWCPAWSRRAPSTSGLYGMPWYAGVRSVVYRTDVFEEAGVEPPTIVGRAGRGRARSSRPPNPDMITVPGRGRQRVRRLPVRLGQRRRPSPSRTATPGPVGSTRPRRRRASPSTPTSPRSTASPRPAATTWDEADLSDAFSRGDVAMMIAGSWTPGALVEANPDLEGKIGAFPIPGQDGGVAPSFLGGSHLSVFEGIGQQGPRVGVRRADGDR